MRRTPILLPALALAACGGEKFDCPDGYREVKSGCVPIGSTSSPTGEPPPQEVPVLQVDPGTLDFGVVEWPCSEVRTVTFQNAGLGVLVIEDMAYDSPTEAFELVEDTVPSFPVELAAGESVSFDVLFDPAEPLEDGDTATLSVAHNDPAAPHTFSHSAVTGFPAPLEESWIVPLPKADIVFLVDVSCSMGDNAANIQAGIPAMFDALDPVSDWQLAAISGPSACVNVPIVTDNTAANAFAVSSSIFQYYQFPETEALFALADHAIDQTGGSECNVGMLRPGAQLHLITVSDEIEQSGRSWFDWVREFEALTPNFFVHAVVDVSRACGDNSGPDGYLEAAQATGGELVDICQASWGEQLAGIADTIEAGEPAPFYLSNEAITESVQVFVDSVPATEFEFDALSWSVSEIRPIPVPGQQVRVLYSPLGQCPTL